MKIHMISYSSESYYHGLQKGLCKEARKFGWDIIGYTKENIVNDPWYISNYTLLSYPRGAGYWAWKPYLIYKTMEVVPKDDIILYCDASVRFRYEPTEFIINEVTKSSIFTLATGFKNRDWCKRDCFVLMNCDSVKYWELHGLWAGVIGIKNNDYAKGFILDWMRYCNNYDIISDKPSEIKMNLPGFVDHRHDQAILTNLVEMYNIKPIFNNETFYDWGE